MSDLGNKPAVVLDALPEDSNKGRSTKLTEEQKSDLATANEDFYEAPKRPSNALQNLSVTYNKTTPEEVALNAWNEADAKRRGVESAATEICDAAPTHEAGMAANSTAFALQLNVRHTKAQQATCYQRHRR